MIDKNRETLCDEHGDDDDTSGYNRHRLLLAQLLGYPPANGWYPMPDHPHMSYKINRIIAHNDPGFKHTIKRRDWYMLDAIASKMSGSAVCTLIRALFHGDDGQLVTSACEHAPYVRKAIESRYSFRHALEYGHVAILGLQRQDTLPPSLPPPRFVRSPTLP